MTSNGTNEMQNMISAEIKNDIVVGLKDIFKEKLVSVILYGSVARGNNGPESDVDIAFIVSGNLTEQEKNVFIHWNSQMDMKHDKVFSIVDIEIEKLTKWGEVVPFYKSILDEGIVLWKAA